MAEIKTRFPVLADTHAQLPPTTGRSGFRAPLLPAEVVLHCGDLLYKGSMAELERAVELLKSLDAPLKLVIAGNHDILLDPGYYAANKDADVSKHHAALALMNKAGEDGIHYLNEGSHTFVLANGARLSVYASPWTPYFGGSAFQYPRKDGHKYAIPEGVDVAMVHGPARGVLDQASRGSHAGCSDLFKAVHRAQPKMFCCGHIHEGWGSYPAVWKPQREMKKGCEVTSAHVIDARNSSCGPTLQEACRRSAPTTAAEFDLAAVQHRSEKRSQTLFLNAAVLDKKYKPTQPPWLVDVLLAKNISGS